MTDDLISRQAAIDAVGINTWAGQRLLKVPSAQPNLQPTCNKLATDCISRQAAIDAVGINTWAGLRLLKVPSAQPEIVRCRKCKWWELTPDNTKLPDWHRCRFYGTIHTRVDEFCSRGERNG